MTEKKRFLFPGALIRTEGGVVTTQGDYVQIIYADLSGRNEINGQCLVKASEPEHNLATYPTIRLSRPSVFRKKGEVLIRDDQEGRARHLTEETEEYRPEGADVIDHRVRAINAALQLGRTKRTISAKQKNTRSASSSEQVTFGKDWMVYCTSMRPSKNEEKAWRETLPAKYTSRAYIYRPSQFAQGLGLAVSEQLGVRGQLQPFTSAFHGFKKVEEQRRTQMILHGPMLYVDDPYRCISEAELEWEKILAMAFLKSTEKNYAAMKEYRFVILQIDPEVGEVLDLRVSGLLRDCLEPVNYPDGLPDSLETVLSEDDTATSASEPQRSDPVYKYRRTTRQRKRESWNGGESDDERFEEEVVEEEVTSPEELPGPFHEEEDKNPDVIVFQQFGTKFFFAHTAHRQDETERWRVRVIRQKDVDEGALGDIVPNH